MRFGRKPWTEIRQEVVKRDKEPARPLAPSGRPYIEVRCHRCHKLLAFAERAMPGLDYVVVPPGDDPPPAPPEPVLSLPEAPDVRLIPAGAGVIALWCDRCHQRGHEATRYTYSPIPPGTNGNKPLT